MSLTLGLQGASEISIPKVMERKYSLVRIKLHSSSLLDAKSQQVQGKFKG